MSNLNLRLTAWRLIAALTLTASLLHTTTSDAAPNRQQDRRVGASPLLSGARIAVVALNSTGGSDVDRIVGDMMTTALRKAGVRVIERQELDVVLREQRLGRDGLLDPATAVPEGKILGVDYLLGVKATEFGIKNRRVGGALALGPLAGLQVRKNIARVVLDMRLLDARTGAVLTTETAEGKETNHGGTLFGGTIIGGINLGGIDIGSNEWSQSSLGKASRHAVNALVQKMVKPGQRVLNVQEGSVLAVLANGDAIVGLGNFDGVRVGDYLNVVRPEVIRDSKGQVVWSENRPVGQLRLMEVRGDRAKASLVDDTLKLVEGDRVMAHRSGQSLRNDR